MMELKTPAEIAGARAAHLRDGAAMAEFLAWFETAAPDGGLTEKVPAPDVVFGQHVMPGRAGEVEREERQVTPGVA